MKKILFILLAITIVSSLCFIQLPSAGADEVQSFVGKIISIVRIPDKPRQSAYAIFTVVSDKDEEATIYVLRSTAITDISGKDMTEGGKNLIALLFKVGRRIEISYATAQNGRNEALSIHALD